MSHLEKFLDLFRRRTVVNIQPGAVVVHVNPTAVFHGDVCAVQNKDSANNGERHERAAAGG